MAKDVKLHVLNYPFGGDQTSSKYMVSFGKISLGFFVVHEVWDWWLTISCSRLLGRLFLKPKHLDPKKNAMFTPSKTNILNLKMGAPSKKEIPSLETTILNGSMFNFGGVMCFISKPGSFVIIFAEKWWFQPVPCTMLFGKRI